MAGGLALVGVLGGKSPWRYLFFLGPILGLACATIADFPRPHAGRAGHGGDGPDALTPWLWRDRLFRLAILFGAAIAVGVVVYLVDCGNSRVVGILQSSINNFRSSGGSDDIRAALYASAIEVLRISPVVDVGLGQILQAAETIFPELVGGAGYDNLDADWANFAAIAGGMGLLAWILLLAASLGLLLDPKRARTEPSSSGRFCWSPASSIWG